MRSRDGLVAFRFHSDHAPRDSFNNGVSWNIELGKVSSG